MGGKAYLSTQFVNSPFIFMINVLHLGLTFACNMHCKNCFVSKSKNILEYEDYIRVINELYQQGLFVVIYTYGEPLLSPLFHKVTEYAKSKDLVQILMTNGSLLNEEWAEQIKRNGISKVFVSLDNVNAEQHDIYRGFAGSHRLAINAIETCISANLNVGVAHTISSDNVMGLFEMFDFICDMNVRSASFLRARINGNLAPLSGIEFDHYQSFFLHCIHKREQLYASFHDPTLRPCLIEQLNNGLISDTVYENFYSMNCCHQQNTISISPDGIVRHCNLSGKPIGLISKSVSISDILETNNDCHENITCCPSISQ